VSAADELTQRDLDSLYNTGITNKDVEEIAEVLPANTSASVGMPAITSLTQVNYELSYYLNTTNATHTQVLERYGAQNTLRDSYTYGLSRLSVQNTQSGQASYVSDGRGSTTGLLGQGGSVLASYAYSPFGEVLRGGAPELPFFAYNGEEYNPATGLQYLRARYLDVADARFGVADTLFGDLASPATLNHYLYAQSNPLTWIDPSGHFSLFNTIKNVASAVVNTVKTVASTVVNTVKSAASWVSNTIFKPVAQAATNAYNTTTRLVQNTYSAGKAFFNAAGQAIGGGLSWLGNQVTAAQAKVLEFVCGSADFLKNTWEKAIDTLKGVDWVGANSVTPIVFSETSLGPVQKASNPTSPPSSGGGIFGAGHTNVDEVVAENPPTSAPNVPYSVTTGTKETTVLSSSGDSTKPISVFLRINKIDPARSSVGVKINSSTGTMTSSLGLDNTGRSYSKNNGNKTESWGYSVNLVDRRIGLNTSITTKEGEYTTLTAFTDYSIDNELLLSLLAMGRGRAAVPKIESGPVPVPAPTPRLPVPG